MQAKNQPIKTDRTLLRDYHKTAEKFQNIPEGAQFASGAREAARSAVEFLKKVGKTTQRVQNVRLKNFDDPTRTEEKQQLDTAKYASKKRKEVNRLYRQTKSPGVAVLDIQERLAKRKEKLANDKWAKEARDRIFDMEPDERIKFVSRAIKEGNKKAAAAVLGAPDAIFAGLSSESYEQLNKRYNERFHSPDMKVIENLTKLDSAVSRAKTEFHGFVKDLNQGLDKITAKANAAQEAMEQ